MKKNNYSVLLQSTESGTISKQKIDSLQEIFLITPNKEEKTKTRNLAEFTSPIQVKIKHRLDDPLPNTYHKGHLYYETSDILSSGVLSNTEIP